MYAGCPAKPAHNAYHWSPSHMPNSIKIPARMAPQVQSLPGDVAFTFVREPIEVFIAAWLEVCFRSNGKQLKTQYPDLGTSLLSGLSGKYVNGTKVFRANVAEIDKGKSLTAEGGSKVPRGCFCCPIDPHLSHSSYLPLLLHVSLSHVAPGTQGFIATNRPELLLHWKN